MIFPVLSKLESLRVSFEITWRSYPPTSRTMRDGNVVTPASIVLVNHWNAAFLVGPVRCAYRR